MSAEKNKKCPLCPPVERKTEWKHEDEICFICRCDDPKCGKFMIVLKRHGEPTEGELLYLQRVTRWFFPGKHFRGYRRKILTHWHEHLVDRKEI